MSRRAEFRLRKAFRDGLVQLKAELRSLTSGGSPLQRQIIEDFSKPDKEQNVQAFASQGASSGGAWAALSPRYAAYKRKMVGAKKILVWSGALRSSATNKGNSDRVLEMRSSVITTGSKHRLAAIHQAGFSGVVYRKAHHRDLGRQRRSKTTGRFGRGNERAQVRGHSARFNLPARPMIRKTAQDVVVLKAAVARAIHHRLTVALRGKIDIRSAALGAAASAGRLRIVRR